MPRKQKDDKDDVERVRKRNRSLRNRERRQHRKPKVENDPNDLGWLKLNGVRMAANKIMNDSYREPAPFWLSVPSDPRPEPVSFYPCRSFQRGDRTWFGFLFREHRDQQILLWGGHARKELTEDARGH
jgi:hypothetical protein